MRRLIAWLVLAGLAAGTVHSAEAGWLFFKRSERNQRTDTRLDRPERLGEGPRLLSQSSASSDRAFVPIPPAPSAEPGVPAARAEWPLIPEPMPLIPGSAGSLPPSPIELFRHVKYDDTDEAHPCGVMRLVAVKDPRSCRRACDCCVTRLVLVEVCVPPSGSPKVKVSRDGRKVELDYGKYEIEIESKKGYVEVEYDD
ncbi:MAG TPA: hypothetical protein VML55_07065 [Planctomycetaceae bacterium]|nr:hypothetical protein [Planctomycetaceae bacterium]